MKVDGPPSRLRFVLCGIAFLASEAVLQSLIWPKWGPTVAFFAGIVPLIFFGWMAGLVPTSSTQRKESVGVSEARTPLFFVIGAAWLVGMISWFPMAEIETDALKQPDRPTAEFTQPLHIKGVVRYVTPKQATIDEIAHWTFLGGWLVGVGGILLDRWSKRKKPNQR
ncbi:MAG: hypothetical protein ACTHLR_16230 [Rhizomicrobium sp.]